MQSQTAHLSPSSFSGLFTDRPPTRPGSRTSQDGGSSQTSVNLFPGVVLTEPDRKTAAVIQRTLCLDNDLLPPLTSSNEIDFHLYAFLALVIRHYVANWYSTITPDHEFISGIVQLVAHVTRGLEERLRHADLVRLLLDDIPGVLEEHILAYRIAREAADRNGGDLNKRTGRLHQVYHSISPHPALSPNPDSAEAHEEQMQNETAWRKLMVEALVGSLVPIEDLRNGCLRALVTELLAETVLGNGLDRASQGFVLWDGISAALGSRCPDGGAQPAQPQSPCLSVASAKQMGRRRKKKTVVRPGDGSTGPVFRPDQAGHDRGFGLVIAGFATAVCVGVQMVVLAAVSLVRAVARAYSLPSRGSPQHEHSRHNKHAGGFGLPSPPAVLEMRIWSCVSTITLAELRVPWLTGFLAFLRWMVVTGPSTLLSRSKPRPGGYDGLLDRLLTDQFLAILTTPFIIPTILQAGRSTVFPNGAPGPPRPPDPTEEDQGRIRHHCARVIVGRLPGVIRDRMGQPAAGPQSGIGMSPDLTSDSNHATAVAQMEDLLGVFQDPYLNKHLIFALVETLMVNLFPELEQLTVEELTGTYSDQPGP